MFINSLLIVHCFVTCALKKQTTTPSENTRMKNWGKPVPDHRKLEKMAKLWKEAGGNLPLDLTNTEIAFADKTDGELKATARLFKLMNNATLVNIGAKLAILAVKLRLPFFETITKKTIFPQFCGGTTLLDSQKSIDRLYKYGVLTVLDYGAEGKESEEEYNLTMNENIRALEFASKSEAIPIISTKLTGLASNALLEKISAGKDLSSNEKEGRKNLLKRMDSICHNAAKTGVAVFIDAEETWYQPAIDHIANTMMKRYNQERVVVYNTFQLYRTDRLAYLMESFNRAKQEGYLLGAKLVRGAYMDKERERAKEKGYPSPIQPTKQATDHDFNLALQFCVENHERIAVCNATHNAESTRLLAKLIEEKGLKRDHPHFLFCQLYGMSDYLTFNLAESGFRSGKYVIYGQVREVVPYLIRRSEENTSITGDMSRERSFIMKEVKRRGL